MQRYLYGFLGLLFAVSLGAFLLYVPMLNAIAVAMILIGMALMFLLGFVARKPLSYRCAPTVRSATTVSGVGIYYRHARQA